MKRRRRLVPVAPDLAPTEPPPAWLERAARRYAHGIYPSDRAVPLDAVEAERRARRDWARLPAERRRRAWEDDESLATHVERTRRSSPPAPLAVPPGKETR